MIHTYNNPIQKQYKTKKNEVEILPHADAVALNLFAKVHKDYTKNFNPSKPHHFDQFSFD